MLSVPYSEVYHSIYIIIFIKANTTNFISVGFFNLWDNIILKNDNKIAKWISEKDNGQCDALNKGFKMATGELVCWLNADDFLLPDAFKNVIKYFKKFPNGEIFYGNYFFVDKYKRIITKRKEIPFDRNILFYYGPYMSSTGSFFKKSMFDEGIFLNTEFRINMDFGGAVNLIAHLFLCILFYIWNYS